MNYKKLFIATVVVALLAQFGPIGYRLIQRPGTPKITFSDSKNLRLGGGQYEPIWPLGADTPQHGWARTYQVFTATADTNPTHTFTRASFDFYICNYDTTATNSVKMKLNSVSNAQITVRGLGCVSVTDYPTTSVIISAGAGTPLYELVAFEVQ